MQEPTKKGNSGSKSRRHLILRLFCVQTFSTENMVLMDLARSERKKKCLFCKHGHTFLLYLGFRAPKYARCGCILFFWSCTITKRYIHLAAVFLSFCRCMFSLVSPLRTEER